MAGPQPPDLALGAGTWRSGEPELGRQATPFPYPICGPNAVTPQHGSGAPRGSRGREPSYSPSWVQDAAASGVGLRDLGGDGVWGDLQ